MSKPMKPDKNRHSQKLSRTMTIKPHLMTKLPLFASGFLFICLAANGREERVASPDGRIVVVVTDHDGLRYRVDFMGKPVIAASRLGLEFKGGTTLGPKAEITRCVRVSHDETWLNRFGKSSHVRDHWNELRLELDETLLGGGARRHALIVRACNDGVGFRYDLPLESQLGDFVLTRELTEFRFTGDHRCWYGGESNCAENPYPESTIGAIPRTSDHADRRGQPFRSVLPLLVETSACHVAIAESDVLDWAGMFLTGTGTPVVTVTPAPRDDGKGLVVSTVPRVSPWRVIMIGATAADLLVSDLVSSLATPNRIEDVSWVKPGISAWDAWWTGTNPGLPQFTGLEARGDTRSHMEYIDLAAEMGWPYQLVDWFWYKDDLSKPLPHVDLPAIFAHARKKGVKLFIWMHSKDLRRIGEDEVFRMVAGWGAVGVKIDFMESDSQETMRWYAAMLEKAARHRLMVILHGCAKPAGLARTYPNLITQEGVLGNEFNKFGGKQCGPSHTVTLPFTRGLLGPMDFTPGGFLNRSPEEFRDTFPAQVIGTRARQLAMTVIYHSPLLVLCDSPQNYRGQPGLEFFRGLPTTWDETVVPDATPGKSVVIARRSGKRWHLAAMNGGEGAALRVPLGFLGAGEWTCHSFSDHPQGSPTDLIEDSRVVTPADVLDLELEPAGGFAAVLSPR